MATDRDRQLNELAKGIPLLIVVLIGAALIMFL
jgi:hypothetical protein